MNLYLKEYCEEIFNKLSFEDYEKTTFCVVLANCPIFLLTVQNIDPFGTFWTVSVYQLFSQRFFIVSMVKSAQAAKKMFAVYVHYAQIS